MRYYYLTKRVIDFSFSCIALIVLLPVFIIIAVLIKLDSKGPIFFKQIRVGKNMANFNIFKFRTMRTDAPKETPTHKLRNADEYITRVGRILRKTSLDELPQIINIINGEMSIIGPRPALWNQYDLITERENYHANNIYPGLTGWAQINGRDDISISEKAKLDGEYVERMNLIFDIKIVLMTFYTVLRSQGVSEGSKQ